MTQAHIMIGFHPLNDCAPLVVAERLGLYEDEGLSVTLSREPSWSNIRDKLAYGLLDAAHMLAPMPLASTIGLGSGGGRLIAPMSLGLNGNSVIVSERLAGAMGAERSPKASALALADYVRARQASGGDPIVFGAPFPYSPQAFVLRDWLASGGIDPARDVSLVIVPPSRMAKMLRDGVIDGFCAGAPWGQDATLSGAGAILFSDPGYWGLKPEKVLGVSPRWAAENPDALRALLRALLRAAQWVGAPENRTSLIATLADPGYVGVDEAVISATLVGELAAGHLAFDAAATFPWLSHAEWFIAQMIRWGLAPPETDAAAIARAVYRPDLWRASARDLGAPAPDRDSKIEGLHEAPWMLSASPAPIAMPADNFFDDRRFEPAAGA